MFDLFFLQCKTKIYTNGLRKLPWYFTVLLILLTAASLGTFISSLIFQNVLFAIVCYILVLLLTFITTVLDHHRNKQVNSIAEDYRTQTIGKLEAQLKSQPYRLYHTAGVDWLIDCCDQHIQPPQKPAPTSVLPYIFSIFTLAYGLVLKEMTTGPHHDVPSGPASGLGDRQPHRGGRLGGLVPQSQQAGVPAAETGFGIHPGPASKLKEPPTPSPQSGTKQVPTQGSQQRAKQAPIQGSEQRTEQEPIS